MKTLITANTEAIDQALAVVSSITDDNYRDRVEGRSQPGAHIRHILDHYRALQTGFVDGVVDYDQRRRACDAETQRLCAEQELLEAKRWLETLSDEAVAVKVKSEVSLNECCSVTLDSDSTRELLYVLNHTVHHLAYLSLLLKANNVEVSENVGLAPATASHLRAVVSN